MKKLSIAVASCAVLLTSPAGAVSYSFTTIDVPGLGSNAATGINNAGQVVFDGGFLYSGGVYSSFSVAPACGVGCMHPSGINNSGQIVGFYNLIGGGVFGFVNSGGTYTTLNVSSTNNTWAYGINDAGQVVGFYNPPVGATQGFFYDGSTYTPLHVPGSIDTEAYGINNAGQIVGHYDGHDSFLYSGGVYTTINDPLANGGTYAFGINNLGEVVGIDYRGPANGFLLENGIFTIIDFPGADYTEAFGINDLGQVVGAYHDASGTHGFLATPTTPLPATLPLFATALGALGLLGWRRKWKVAAAISTT